MDKIRMKNIKEACLPGKKEFTPWKIISRGKQKNPLQETGVPALHEPIITEV
ncbi:hypothetical protein [Desulfospira joergensenii]|uniref:hypothetical protein n=1 Tax=Desulfospira joergensenii TaxID=53329 RepID=UPI0003B4CB7B|nr:hypothetical protein [Desulfospira joergensenii]